MKNFGESFVHAYSAVSIGWLLCNKIISYFLNRLYEGSIWRIHWESVLQYKNSQYVLTATVLKFRLKQDAQHSKLKWRSFTIQKKGWALVNSPTHLWEFYMLPCLRRLYVTHVSKNKVIVLEKLVNSMFINEDGHLHLQGLIKKNWGLQNSFGVTLSSNTARENNLSYSCLKVSLFILLYAYTKKWLRK